jgi:colicin import membrane protein
VHDTGWKVILSPLPIFFSSSPMQHQLMESPMATAKPKAKAKVKPKKSSAKKMPSFDVSKYINDIKIGDVKLEAVLKGNSKNMDAIAAANKAIIEGYTDVAKRQYEMLKDLLDEVKGIAGSKDTTKELKKLVDHAKKDVQTLQKMAKKTNSDAQKIIKKRTDATVKAWKKVIDDTKKKVTKKAPAKKKAAAKKKAPARKKVAAKKKAPAKK